MAVSVQFEIGHTAKLKAKKTPEGFTHDWELYVRGFNKADISAYVDKVVFNLHESFQKPKRVCKEPPYVVHESGYAGFVLTVDIHFRNRDEPKRVQYPYDLDLQPHGPPYGPPHHRSEEKRFVFEKPSEEFRLKLLKGGGVPVVPAGLTGSRSHSLIAPSSFAEPTANMQQSSTSSASKHKSNSAGSVAGDNNTKKHKTRTDDTKLNTFANLFGPPDPSSKTSSAKTNADAPKNSNFNNNSSGKTLSPNATPSMTSSGASSLKDRPIKETKDKQSSNISAEKSKEKSERKEKHKSSSSASPNKDGRSEGKKSSTSLTLNAESGKSEKQRSEDKPKKEKNRDKDRERSSSGAPSSNSGISKSSSSKPSTAATAASSASLLRTSTHGSVGSSSANKIEEKSVSSKSEKDTKEKHSSSSSSGKKSKKDKKEKDKDRDKEKDKDKEKEKREEKQRISGGSHDLKSKEERSHSSASQSYLSCSPSGQSTPNSSLTVQPQAKATTAINIVGSSSNNANNKKTEKDLKGSESLKTKSSVKSDEKTVSGAITTSAIPVGTADKKSATPNSSNSASSSTKSHKHKKKDKNKDKDKERDKEKEKERNSTGDKEKEKPKEKQKQKEKVEEKKEIEKSSEIISNKLATVATNEAKKPATTIQPVTTIASLTQQQTASTQATPSSTNANESGISKKKSQNKEKKAKDSKSSKDAKRRSEASTPTASVGCEPKSKVSKTSTPLSTAGSNIDLSDADSRQSSHENINKTITATAPVTATAPELHSDSSYSSFPDLSVKPKEKLPAISTSSNISTEKTSKTTSTVPSSKEHKREEKAKISTKNTEKTRKTEKDDKKRRRNTVQSENAFIEPPVKQAKKEQNKPAATTRESTKSPLPSRSGSVANSARPVKSLSETNLTTDAAESQLHLPAHISSNITAAATATAMSLMPTNTNINTVAGVANHTNSNNANSVISQRNNLNVNTMHPTSPALSSNDALCPNLSELQELHHKIMTLQDNQDLQQIVEMIAASGCYEVTQRTFDFDLCKLDRGTVERLQEFFATSVS